MFYFIPLDPWNSYSLSYLVSNLSFCFINMGLQFTPLNNGQNWKIWVKNFGGWRPKRNFTVKRIYQFSSLRDPLVQTDKQLDILLLLYKDYYWAGGRSIPFWKTKNCTQIISFKNIWTFWTSQVTRYKILCAYTSAYYLICTINV